MTATPGRETRLELSIAFADTAVVAVAGELDLATAPDLAAMLDALFDRGHRHFTIDCTELGFIDASGLVPEDLGSDWPQFRHPKRPEFLLTAPHRHGTSGFFVARLRK